MKLMHRARSAIAKIGLRALRLSGFYRSYWQHWRGGIFDYAEAQGLHILPVHYYSPIPSSVDTARRRRPNKMTGVKIDFEAGAVRAAHLIEMHRRGIDEVLAGAGGYKTDNGGFFPLDAALLYAIIRDVKPKRIIEIGSGMSTLVMLSAMRELGRSVDLTCIEPYLPAYLKARRSEINTVIESPLQDLSTELFGVLESGDILFIDSTHVVRFDSDVVFEILEILPTLKPGVIVHVHDIFLPNDYPQEWLTEHRFFWSEQYMLQAFLSMNPNFQIEIPVAAIKDMISLDGVLRPTSNIQATSLWMRRL
jgi:predicted O-methyltransferase YrrM